MEILCLIIQIYVIICIARVVMSWIGTDTTSSALTSILGITYGLTEPVFGFVRRSIPALGNLPLDISPMIVIMGLLFVQSLIC